MKLLYNQKINKEIKEEFIFSFETNEGISLIEVIAKAKSWWQNFKSFRSLFKDDDIILNLDNTEIFTSNSKDEDVKAIWNGNELRGMSKTVLVAIFLKKGGHILRFKPDQSPSLESIKIMELEKTDNNTIVFSPLDNNPPEKRDRRPWLSCVLQNLTVKEINILASANKQGRDDEDIKLIIDGKVENNENKNSHKDWYWCGKILKGKEAVFKKMNFEKGKHSIELWSDGSPHLNKIEVSVLSDSNNRDNKETVKPYNCKGAFGNEDYNRYDMVITEMVNYWNSEFLKDTNPPNEPLDPNLVKAIIYQESRVGYYRGAEKNIMQVGNPGDPSLETLRGEFKEYWIHNNEKILLKYDVKIETVKDSINWGVRWLFHKAQGITPDNKRYWKTWKEAVLKYGPGKQKYADSVWDIYKLGIKKEKNKTIHLWSIILFALIPLLSFGIGTTTSLQNKIKNEISKDRQENLEDIEIKYSSVDNNYFLAQIEWEKDWWEDFKVGKLKNGREVEWLSTNNPPEEQAILSANFLNLRGFGDPLIEVYGITHAGHGNLYIYEIKDNALNLLFKIRAVDSNSDIKWAPENYKKYGYENCGEVYTGGKLTVEYKDVNKDGVSDLLLNGIKEIICEKQNKHFQNVRDIKVENIKIDQEFLWDKNKNTWL